MIDPYERCWVIEEMVIVDIMVILTNCWIVGLTVVAIISIAMVLRSQLEPLPALLWLAWSVLVPFGGLCTMIYLRRRSRHAAGR